MNYKKYVENNMNFSYTRSKWLSNGRDVYGSGGYERQKTSGTRARTRWKDIVMKDLKIFQEVVRINTAYSREMWNEFVMAASDLNGPVEVFMMATITQ